MQKEKIRKKCHLCHLLRNTIIRYQTLMSIIFKIEILKNGKSVTFLGLI